LTENIAAIFMQQFQQKGVAFYMQIDERLSKEVIADESRIMQVLHNLLSNALKRTHADSVSLNIQLQSANADQIKVNFSITDTASGIPPYKTAEGLESFTGPDLESVRAAAGTGLALAISEKIIQLCGGKLSVERVERKGSRFHFTIPLTVNEVTGRMLSKAYIKPLKPLNGINVLLVEDNTINMLVARRFLSSWDVTIKEAVNGQEAVDLFKTFNFDLIILDLEMPVMDGYKAVAQIRKLDPDVPVIAFTASVFDDMKNVLLAAGFNDFIPKPFRPEDLHKIIDTYAIRA
jgi:CheY-like chemotaxis protein